MYYRYVVYNDPLHFSQILDPHLLYESAEAITCILINELEGNTLWMLPIRTVARKQTA